MTTTTTDSMNFLLEKNDRQVSVKMPSSMKTKITKCAKRLKMNESRYIKQAINEKLDRDLSS